MDQECELSSHEPGEVLIESTSAKSVDIDEGDDDTKDEVKDEITTYTDSSTFLKVNIF